MALFQTVKNLDVDTVNAITAIATVSIALFAFLLSAVGIFFSIREGIINRRHNSRVREDILRHNRLSVRPAVEVCRVSATSEERWGIFLKNAGVGPAIIQSVILTVNGEEYPIRTEEEWKKVYKSIEKSLHEKYRDVNFVPLMNKLSIKNSEKGSAIAPGESSVVLCVLRSSLSNGETSYFRELINLITPKVYIESLYGEKFEAAG